MTDEDAELLHVDGKTFDTDDLTYEERREIKRMCRLEIWDEAVDGRFVDMSEDDIMPAVIAVFMRREDPAYTLEQAMACKPAEVFQQDPPTKPAPKRSSAQRSAAAKASGTSGSQK